MSTMSEKMRVEWKANDAKRDEGLEAPPNVSGFKNINYGPDNRWQTLDVYRPSDFDGEYLPCIVIVHGGGWVYGDKELYSHYAMDLSKRGFAVLCFTYRLAPENKYPAQIEDCCLAINWLWNNADKFKINRSEIFLVGDSAGAHLTGLLCAINTNKSYADQYDFNLPDGFKPVAIGMNCGAYSLFNSNYQSTIEINNELIGDLIPDDFDALQTLNFKKQINMIEYVNEQFPPAHIVTGYGDFLFDQAEILANSYRQNGLLFEYKIYGSASEPLGHVFHLDMRNSTGIKCNDDQCNFFKQLI